MEKNEWSKKLLDKISITELTKVPGHTLYGYKWYDEKDKLVTSKDYDDEHIFLCENDDGKLTDRYNRIIRKEKVLIPQWRNVKSEEEFHNLIENISEFKITESDSELYPSIFEKGAFEIFKIWMNISNKDRTDQKISFIIQKLKKENKLRKTNFKDLSEWAYNNNYLNEGAYANLLEKGYFLSPSKILTKSRLELYNSIIGK
jgi:hypothetical protein